MITGCFCLKRSATSWASENDRGATTWGLLAGRAMVRTPLMDGDGSGAPPDAGRGRDAGTGVTVGCSGGCECVGKRGTGASWPAGAMGDTVAVWSTTGRTERGWAAGRLGAGAG